jgi:DNA end-binding protein Ku
MAKDLIDSMSSDWKPGDYRDDFRDKLRAVIEKRLKSKGVTATIEEDDRTPENATTNVVDFMALLKKSLGAKTRTPAKKTIEATKKAAKSAPAKKTAAKKAPAKTAASKGAATKGAAGKKGTPAKTAARKAPATRRKAG